MDSDGVDAAASNGCAPQDIAGVTHDDADTMSVCRYGADGWLEQSELLTGEDATDALAAIDEAPRTDYSPPCAAPVPNEAPGEYVVLQSTEDRFVVRWSSTCEGDRGVFDSDPQRHELTADVMYWALSPGWSGGVDGDVPLPPELRSR